MNKPTYYEQVRDKVEEIAVATTSDAQAIIEAWEHREGEAGMIRHHTFGTTPENLARLILRMPPRSPRTFVGPDGHMYRDKETSRPFRSYFAAWPHNRKIQTVKQLKGAIRAGAVAYGGYSPFYATSDGAALCDKCTRENFRNIADSIATRTNDGWRIVAVDMDSEVEDMQCDHCNSPIGYQTEPEEQEQA